MSLIKQAALNRQAIMEALSKANPATLLAEHPSLTARAGEAGIGAGVGGAAGYATGDEGGLFSDDTHLRNALAGAGIGAASSLGGSALARHLLEKGMVAKGANPEAINAMNESMYGAQLGEKGEDLINLLKQKWVDYKSQA